MKSTQGFTKSSFSYLEGWSISAKIGLIAFLILGRKCREGCTRVNIISNDEPPPKGPDEKMFLLKSIRQIMPNDDLKNSLELEFKLPRNYLPLRKFDSPPRIIIPNAFAETEIKKRKKKTKSEKKKGTK